ncbi:hypothetical protein QBC37DRAFT_102491 [Rhypophila decipiens]|uniref:Uncharacterized protein n=1 Tax=Rhypophila decipiens TaxID=261697 RepID=A0AAN6XUS7_9PEZI|nr:hypothetical protein QBC37DRAFT_102491 [Rhypophila decipiens]
MLTSPLSLILPLAVTLLPSTVTALIDPSTFKSSAIRTSDVVIIGGGSSGTYAAVALKRAGKSITLIEKASRLGGHVDTFKDPGTGATFDYGVVAFANRSTVTNYFSSFNEALVPFSQFSSGQTNNYVNLNTNGQIINPLPSSIPWSDPAAVFGAILGYSAQISQYPFLTNGYDLPTTVPEDLLLPFGDFLAKYNLGAIAQLIFTITQGLGNVLSQTTLYVFKNLPLATLNAFIGLAPPPITSATFNTQSLYDKALSFLSPHVFLSSTILAIDRSNPLNRVLVVVSTPSGPKLIIAKKLLLAIQPKLSTLQTEIKLPLVPEETNLFSKFNNTYYWNFVLKNTNLPAANSYSNIDPSTPFGLPILPSSYGFTPVPSIPQPGGQPAANYTLSWFSSPSYLSDAQVKSTTLNMVNKVVTANGYAKTKTPQVVGFNAHNPFWLTVSAAAIRDGFYDKLNGLQGKRNTFWTGATFVGHDSSAIWEWSEATLLPALLAAL